MKTLRRTVRWFLVLLTAGFIGLNILAYNQAYAMLHYSSAGERTKKAESLSLARKVFILLAGTNVPRPQGRQTPADFALRYETVRVTADDSIRLEAWHCPAPDTQTMVILFHGYALDKTSQLPVAAAFHKLGIPCLLVDFRGSGGSSASHTTVGFEESRDVEAAFRYARTRFPASRLVLYGSSMGGAAILRAIAHRGVAPDAIIIESVFDSLLKTVENRFHAMRVPAFPNAQLLVFWGGRQFGFDGFSLNPAKDAGTVRCPALFLHGTGDPRALPNEGRRVYEAVPGPKRFQAFPSSSHEDTAVLHPEQWLQAVQPFLQEAFPPHAA